MQFQPLFALDDLGQWLDSISPHDRAQVTVACIIGLVAMTGIICALIRSMHRFKTEASLKRDMIQQGQPADEIERIIAAKSGPKITRR
jgi:hypothetical protein